MGVKRGRSKSFKERAIEEAKKLAARHAESKWPGDEHEKKTLEAEAVDLVESSFACISQVREVDSEYFSLTGGDWTTRHPELVYQDSESFRFDERELSNLTYDYIRMKWLRCTLLDWFFTYTLCYAGLLPSLRDATFQNDSWLRYQSKTSTKSSQAIGWLGAYAVWEFVKLAVWLVSAIAAYQIDPALTVGVAVIYSALGIKSLLSSQHYQRSITPLIALNAYLGNGSVHAEQLLPRLKKASEVAGFEPGLYELLLVMRDEQRVRRKVQSRRD